jgi:hypothetical protein
MMIGIFEKMDYFCQTTLSVLFDTVSILSNDTFKMARKLSRVSAEEMADLNKKLDEIFADFAEEGGGITKQSLMTFASEGGLCDKKLKEADVGMIFESVKLGKKTVIGLI